MTGLPCSPPGQEIVSASPLVVATPPAAGGACLLLPQAGGGDLIDHGATAGPRLGHRRPGEGRRRRLGRLGERGERRRSAGPPVEWIEPIGGVDDVGEESSLSTDRGHQTKGEADTEELHPVTTELLESRDTTETWRDNSKVVDCC